MEQEQERENMKEKTRHMWGQYRGSAPTVHFRHQHAFQKSEKRENIGGNNLRTIRRKVPREKRIIDLKGLNECQAE